MQTLTEIKVLLGECGLHPKKALGQNFLIDQNLVTKLVDAAGVGDEDLVLEVGPGTGVLTDALVERGCRVVASELDDALCDLLGERFGDRVTLVRGDCLGKKSQLSAAVRAALGDAPFTLVANLPYGCATPLLMTLLTKHAACRGMFVTVQQEVGDRLAAGPADGKVYGAISAVAWWLCRVEKIAKLGPACFWPRPEVHSVMIALRRREIIEPEADSGVLSAIAATVGELFRSRRKQIGSTLKRMGAGGVELPDGVAPTDRPEQIEPGALVELALSIAGATA